mmetsp:Transcript_90164/g.232756  ORF Transcript_90164/g.232756 Transcript_90164/m.232756 type:complete len:214 (+) Transcript_90164:53-694(+)
MARPSRAPCFPMVSAACFVLAAATAQAVSSSAGELDPVAMTAGDECWGPAQQSEGACALNALQLRAVAGTAAASNAHEVAESIGFKAHANGTSGGTLCKNFMVKGKVQMVHYRNWAVGRSKAYGVKGWVANGGDSSLDGGHSRCPTCGCVLGHVEGTSQAVDAFVRDMCKGGPPHSYVTSCKVEVADCYYCPSFYKEYRFCPTWTVQQCKSRC